MLFVMLGIRKLIKRFTDTTISQLNTIWFVTLTALLIMDSIPAMPYIIARIKDHMPVKEEYTVFLPNSTYYGAPPVTSTASDEEATPIPQNTLPNIYLMIFD